MHYPSLWLHLGCNGHRVCLTALKWDKCVDLGPRARHHMSGAGIIAVSEIMM